MCSNVLFWKSCFIDTIQWFIISLAPEFFLQKIVNLILTLKLVLTHRKKFVKSLPSQNIIPLIIQTSSLHIGLAVPKNFPKTPQRFGMHILKDSPLNNLGTRVNEMKNALKCDLLLRLCIFVFHFYVFKKSPKIMSYHMTWWASCVVRLIPCRSDSFGVRVV